MTKENKIFADKRIGIMGKGGSGKSTITVLLAKAFKNYGYQVCVLDADSTNIGIHQALGFKKSPSPLMDYFGGAVFSGGAVSCPVDDPTHLAGSEISLKEIPIKYYSQDQNELFLFVLGKIGDKGPGAGCDGPISKITRDLRIREIGNKPVTLIDIKAGLEDSARGVITGMDWLITVVDPNTAAIQIAADIKNLVHQIQAGELPSTEHLESPELVEKAKKIFREAKIKKSFVIMNRIKNKKIENYVKEKLNEKGISPIGVIHEDNSIPLSWIEGNFLEGIKAKKDIIQAIKRLEKVIKEQQ
ncbi:MAG: P-loop NTPase [Candidatus Marinimicrobia bacterium]|nr:P-loop NTPase [Candidatus Neomarinimicrobiota bacterium]MCK4447330.1 P-loop NTPase [Candidatus Neomarinimicrobiota bacterium]